MTDKPFTEILHIGNVPFLYFDTPDGGRLVPAAQIKSIYPDFKNEGGGILFFVDSEKSIKIMQTPAQIVDDLIGDDDDDETTPTAEA